MIQKDGVDVEMLPDDWKRTGHVIQKCDFFEKDTFNKIGYKAKINTHTTSYIN